MTTPPIRLYRDLVADQQLSYDLIRQAVRSGDLVRIRRGAYSHALETERAAKHLQLVRATWPQLASDLVLSHTSAAVRHGLPTFDDLLDRVWVTRTAGGHGRDTSTLRVYRRDLAEDEIVLLDHARWTSPAKTVADMATALPLGRGVAVVDAGLRAGIDPDEVMDCLSRHPRRQGAAHARQAVSFGDGASESVGESESRVVFHVRGLPPPTLQFEVTYQGQLLGRSDFAWEEQRLLGEFDGRIKYSTLLRPGQSAADVLLAEKRREQRLRAAGWWVVRWDYDAIVHPERLERIILDGFRQATAFRRAS